MQTRNKLWVALILTANPKLQQYRKKKKEEENKNQ